MNDTVPPAHMFLLQAFAKEKKCGGISALLALYADAADSHAGKKDQNQHCIRQTCMLEKVGFAMSISRETGVFVQLKGVAGSNLEMVVGQLWCYEAAVAQSSHVGVQRWT